METVQNPDCEVPLRFELIAREVDLCKPEGSIVEAISLVQKQPATEKGAIVLLRYGCEYISGFYNARIQRITESAVFTDPEAATKRYLNLCIRFWVGMPPNTRPNASIWPELST